MDESPTTLESAHPNKDLKVRIPVKYHMQLHTLKILRGKSLSDAVAEALDDYFTKQPPS